MLCCLQSDSWWAIPLNGSLVILEYLLDVCVQGEEERHKIASIWNQLIAMIENKEVGLQFTLRDHGVIKYLS